MRIYNDCPYLSITESAQDELRLMGIEKNHMCLKFGQRVYHRATKKEHSDIIYPCFECCKAIITKCNES